MSATPTTLNLQQQELRLKGDLDLDDDTNTTNTNSTVSINSTASKRKSATDDEMPIFRMSEHSKITAKLTLPHLKRFYRGTALSSVSL